MTFLIVKMVNFHSTSFEKNHRQSGLPTLCFKKSGNFAKCLTYVLPQAIGLPSHRRSKRGGALFPFLSGVTEFFCKIKSKFLNSRVLAGGFVMGCAKKSWF